MTETFSNNAESTLDTAIDADDVSVIVDDATTFPAAGNFRLRIDDEIMLVTAVAGATYTVTRGQEGTTAASHSAGAQVRHVLTAAALRNLTEWDGEIVKTDTSTVTNSITMTNDSQLEFAVDAGAQYLVEFWIIASGNDAAGDYAWDFSLPTLTLTRQAQGYYSGLSLADASVLNHAIGGASPSHWPGGQAGQGIPASGTKLVIHGRFSVSTTNAGTVHFRSANWTAGSGRNSITNPGSRIRWKKLA